VYGMWARGTTTVEEKNWTAIAYGNGVFVAVGTGGIGNRAMSSVNGINWTIRPSSADNAWSAVAYGNGVFVAVASGGSNRVMTSSNSGHTWTGRPALGITWPRRRRPEALRKCPYRAPGSERPVCDRLSARKGGERRA